MAAPRLRKATTQKEMENLIDDYVTQGYEIVERGERSTMMRRKTWGTASGHFVWFLLTVWFTAGLGNLAYALIAHFTAEQVFIKQEGE
jgi:hypothetical protein